MSCADLARRCGVARRAPRGPSRQSAALTSGQRRVVVNPHQARELLVAVTYVGRSWRGRHLRAFFACMYFAALRPGEVKALRTEGCFLPATGWGRLTLSRSRPQSNRRWTDSGEAPRGG